MAAIARALDVHPAVVTRQRRMGMPIDSIEAARAWREQHLSIAHRKPAPGETPAAPRPGDRRSLAFQLDRARRERAQADLAEMKAADLAKSLVRVDEVRRQWAVIASEVCTALLQIPARVAPVLAQRDVASVRHTLDLEIRGVLERLAKEAG